MQVKNNSLRARLIKKIFFHECATYQPAIDQSDRSIQTVIVQVWLFPGELNILARLFFVNINPSSRCMCKIYLVTSLCWLILLLVGQSQKIEGSSAKKF